MADHDPRAWVERCPLELAEGTIDFARSRFVRADGKVTPLSARESELLAFLADHPNQTVSRDDLLVEVWGHSDLSMSRAADTAIARLRRKIEPSPAEPRMLVTDHGYGYRLLVLGDEVVAARPTLPRRQLQLGDRTVDLSSGTVDVGEERTPLTAQERLMLEELLRVEGHPIDVRRLARKVGIASEGAVRSAVHRLRQKIEPDPGDPKFLISSSGGAYRLDADLEDDPIPTRERLAALFSLADHVGKVMGFVDCVVYLRASDSLRQVAAHGPKLDPAGELIGPLVQAIGEGIVGAAAATAEPLIIDDVRDDSRYLPDIAEARSELAVPVLAMGKVVGVIDAENPRAGAFDVADQYALMSLATIAAPAFVRIQGVTP